MASLSLTEQADADIDDILTGTRRRWGEAKYWEYLELIQEGLTAIAADPTRGRPRSARPGVLAHHIKQPGRNARHLLFYRVHEHHVTVLRVPHDARDFERHLPPGS